MYLDKQGHFVRQRRVFIALSVLLAALYFFCLDLKSLSIFGVNADIQSQSWINGILWFLWFYYLYRFWDARAEVGGDWHLKEPMKKDAGLFAQKYYLEALLRKENIEKAFAKTGLTDSDDWNTKLEADRFSGGPETTRYFIANMRRNASVKYVAGSPSHDKSGAVKIEVNFGTKATWKTYVLTARKYLFQDARIGEYYLPLIIGPFWLVIYLFKIKKATPKDRKCQNSKGGLRCPGKI